LPVVIITGLAAILFMIGYALIGVTMIGTATLPRWTGVLVARRRGVASGSTNSLGSAGAVSWRNIVIEPEEVVRVVLPLH
jgi:hypothetical protein